MERLLEARQDGASRDGRPRSARPRGSAGRQDRGRQGAGQRHAARQPAREPRTTPAARRAEVRPRRPARLRLVARARPPAGPRREARRDFLAGLGRRCPRPTSPPGSATPGDRFASAFSSTRSSGETCRADEPARHRPALGRARLGDLPADRARGGLRGACALLRLRPAPRRRARARAPDRRGATACASTASCASTFPAAGASALTDPALAVPRHALGGEPIPITYVPARNTLFLAHAVAWGEALSAVRHLHRRQRPRLLGLPGLPARVPRGLREDGEPRHAAPASKARLAFRIHAPLLRMTKAEIVKRAPRLGLDFGSTTSCYDPGARWRALRRLRLLPSAREGLSRKRGWSTRSGKVA